MSAILPNQPETWQQQVDLVRQGKRNAYIPRGTHVGYHEDVYITGDGQVITGLHPPDACVGYPCVIHAPSNHPMLLWPTHFRDAITELATFGLKPGLMERMCPHGIGHPDPDSVAFLVRVTGDESWGVHGCDGCCAQ